MIFTKGQNTQAVQNQRKRREFRLWIGFKKMQGHLMLHGIGGIEDCKSEGRSVLWKSSRATDE